ncbi:hypothetical protein MLD38_029765 [Melastoma candidum]|uniref:Uncharacterized protein n=1 Tax=Melastoma candidum TaxID=119954 RepID=A0ACB9N4Y2_9MYRT|nr:hypothetical protein MLD38_029765 [Melastoma candidum]
MSRSSLWHSARKWPCNSLKLPLSRTPSPMLFPPCSIRSLPRTATLLLSRNKYLRWLGREDAIELFFRIPKFRCVHTVDSINALLFVLCRMGESARMVPAVLSKCRVMGDRVDETSFRVLIGALCRFRKVGWAVEVFRIVVGEGFGVDAEKCLRILVGMNHPNVGCYTVTMTGLVKEDEFEKADELFDKLLVSGLVPDVSTYSVYMRSLRKRDDIEAAIRVASSMG